MNKEYKTGYLILNHSAIAELVIEEPKKEVKFSRVIGWLIDSILVGAYYSSIAYAAYMLLVFLGMGE